MASIYELLTGKTPFDAQDLLAAGLEQMRRTIREKEPLKPSTRLSQQLVGADVRRLTAKSEMRDDSRRGTANMLLAMSSYQSRQPDEARAALASGLELAATKLPKLESGDLGRYWPDWVFAHVLMREARALIEGGAKASEE